MVQLMPMTHEEYPAYIGACQTAYAREKVRAGHWFADSAAEAAHQAFASLLPQGLSTPNHFFYTIVDEAQAVNVGALWVHLQPSEHHTLWVYDLIIGEEFRRLGYGRQALLALEEKARQWQAEKLELHVFAHNRGAIALYEQVGYTLSSLNFYKRLSA